MNHETPEHIEIRSFSPTFEKMCNFMAVAKIGDPRATIRGLIMLCLLEFPDEKFEEAVTFCEFIETLFGLVVPNDQIESALNELIQTNTITCPGNTNYRLEHRTMSTLKEAIKDSQALEYKVKEAWFKELAVKYPELPPENAWQSLRSYLCSTFRRHGIQATALLDPTIDTPEEHVTSLTSILFQSITEHISNDNRLRSIARSAISEFMAVLGRDPDRANYIAQLADGAFNFYTLEVPADLSALFRKQLNELILFLDTNFLFGILDLHYNTQVQVSHDLLRAINDHKIPFKLRYHEATKKEMSNTIKYYGAILRSRSWSRSLSRAARTSRNISGIEQKFHQRNAEGLIDTDEFLRPLEHFDFLLAEKDIKLFRPHETRIEAQNELFREYQAFLEKSGRGDKSHETIMHDAKVIEEAHHLRSNALSSLDAGALVISCDYFLYRFDWESSRNNNGYACVLLPNIFWQILRPFIPSDQNFDKAFAETFALPEFRAIGSGGNKACSKMLQILAAYKEVPEQTAMRMLSNDLLLDKLRSELDDTNFSEQVEMAFIEENRNLLEEISELEKELKHQKISNEEDSQKRQAELSEFDDKKREFSEAIKNTMEQLSDAKQAIIDREQKAKEAQKSVLIAEQKVKEATVKAAEEEEAKGRAERKAFQMSVVSGLAVSLAVIILFLVLVHSLPWAWLIMHNNAVLLQICISVILLFSSLGLFVKVWRKWCWSVGGFAFLVTLFSLMGS